MLSVDILAASDRILSLAALAIFRDSEIRHVGEALKAVVRLSEDPREMSLTEPISGERLAWRELYRRHHSFLGTLSSSLPAELSSGVTLDFKSHCQPREVLDPIVSAGPALTWGENQATAPAWPGPASELNTVVAPFFSALGQAVEGEGIVRLEECLSGLELIFPGRSVRQILQPVISSSAEELSRQALDLIGGCLRLTHQGCTFDFLPEPNQTETRLRIGFDVSRVERAPDDPYEELAADLVGNELFWSRFLD